MIFNDNKSLKRTLAATVDSSSRKFSSEEGKIFLAKRGKTATEEN
jgi:hypothetical protein